MGARQLCKALTRPLLDLVELQARLESVEELYERPTENDWSDNASCKSMKPYAVSCILESYPTLDSLARFLYARCNENTSKNALIRISRRASGQTASRESASRRAVTASNPPESAGEKLAGTSPLREERLSYLP